MVYTGESQKGGKVKQNFSEGNKWGYEPQLSSEEKYKEESKRFEGSN